jgi:hypothetical protein
VSNPGLPDLSSLADREAALIALEFNCSIVARTRLVTSTEAVCDFKTRCTVPTPKPDAKAISFTVHNRRKPIVSALRLPPIAFSSDLQFQALARQLGKACLWSASGRRRGPGFSLNAAQMPIREAHLAIGISSDLDMARPTTLAVRRFGATIWR